MLEPVLNYQVYFPNQVDAHTMLGYMRQIEEEDPMLRVIWNEELGEIHVQRHGRGADRDSEKSGKRTIRSRCDIWHWKYRI